MLGEHVDSTPTAPLGLGEAGGGLETHSWRYGLLSYAPAGAKKLRYFSFIAECG